MRTRYSSSRRKRLVDLMLATIGSIVFLPIALFIAARVFLEDKGNLFFRQERLGLKRHLFEVLKFRTMRDGVVTRVGAWLRKSGLDEIAQFVNIFDGSMSMVGPRPLTRLDVERLGWSGQRHDRRFATKPGITGLAQLFGGHSGRESYRLDMQYLRTASPRFDLWLVFLSVLVNVLGKQRFRRLFGAYRRSLKSLRRALARIPDGLSARVSTRLLAHVRARGHAHPRPGTRTPARAFARAPIRNSDRPLDRIEDAWDGTPAMITAPRLPSDVRAEPIEAGFALLVNPFYPKDRRNSYGKHVLTPTLALTSIAGATPPGWRVTYWDENLLQGPPPSSPRPEVVGITVHLTSAHRAYALARWYRALGSKVVLGGLHVMSCPDEAEPHADAIAIGDGVALWPEILDDVRSNRLKRRYSAGFAGSLRDAPLPARHILPKRSFLTTASINATRGCHNRCGFCYLATPGLKMPYRTRGVDRVLEEIRSANEPYVVFTDNNLGSDREYLRELAQAMRELEIIWSAAVTIDITDDPELVRTMALSGCTGVFVGFESLSDENLAHARKRTPRTEEYARRVRVFHDNGIQVNGSFVFGFDEDRPDVFEKTVRWIEENRLECATFHVLTPYPGTPLFRELEAEGRILHRDWRLYDTGHVVFEPRHMSPEELEEGYAWAYRELFSHGSIWRRRPEDGSAVPAYLAMAYLYKRSNWLWRWLIASDLTRTVWTPFVELSRRRHLAFRRKLAALPVADGHRGPRGDASTLVRPASVVSAGV